jgi:Fe/S biogenesis protein NfuA
MLTFTSAAREKVLDFLARHYDEDAALRVAMTSESSPLAPEYDLMIIEGDDVEPEDVVFDTGDFRVVADETSARSLGGCVVDFTGTRFDIRTEAARASAPAPADGELAERIRAVIEARINPGVASHGGQISLVGVQDTTAFVQMSGGCQGCGMARVTLRQGVERMIREAVPEITAVHDVTDHVQGTNPYYQAAH